MNPVSIPLLASLFTVGGVLLSLPSLVVLIGAAAFLLTQRFAAPAGETRFGDNPDALLLMLQGITQAISGLASLVGTLAQIVIQMAAVIAGAGLVLGLTCWFIGRGLGAEALWARFAAAAVLTLVTLAAALLALSVSGMSRMAMAVVVVIAVLGLHALWLGHAPIVR